MRPVLATAAVFSFAAASSAFDGRGEAMTRSLQTTVLEHARHVYRDYNTRRLQFGDGAGATPGEDFDICSIFEMFDAQLEEEGVACDCSTENSVFTLACNTTESFDKEKLKDPEYGSITFASVKVSVSIENGSSSSETCATLGGDYYIEQLRGETFCVGVSVTMTLGGDAGDGGNESEPDFDFNLDDFFIMTCTAELTDKECECNVCEDYTGINITCPGDGSNRLVMDCTGDFAMSTPATGEGFGDDSDGGAIGAIGDVESSFIVPHFVEQEIVAVDDSPDQGEGKDGNDEGDENEGTEGAGTENGGTGGSGNSSKTEGDEGPEQGEGKDGKNEGDENEGTEGAGAENGGTGGSGNGGKTEGDDGVGPAGDDNSGAGLAIPATLPLVASTMALVLVSALV